VLLFDSPPNAARVSPGVASRGCVNTPTTPSFATDSTSFRFLPPQSGLRQWVLTFPFSWRRRLAQDGPGRPGPGSGTVCGPGQFVQALSANVCRLRRTSSLDRHERGSGNPLVAARARLQRLTRRKRALDRGRISSWPCSCSADRDRHPQATGHAPVPSSPCASPPGCGSSCVARKARRLGPNLLQRNARSSLYSVGCVCHAGWRRGTRRCPGAVICIARGRPR
jgi:hypothetical protein